MRDGRQAAVFAHRGRRAIEGGGHVELAPALHLAIVMLAVVTAPVSFLILDMSIPVEWLQRRSRLCAAMMILALLGVPVAPFALAQLAGSPKGDPAKDAGTAAPAESDPKAARARIEQKVSRLREQLTRIRSGAEPPPPGISPAETDNARKGLAVLVLVYEGQLEALAQVEERRKEREAAEKNEQEWPGFKEAQPYSILVLDNVREEVDTHRASVDALESSCRVVEIEIEKFRGRARQAEEAVRRASEVVESAARGTDARAAAAWRLEAARDQARLAAGLLELGSMYSRDLDGKLAVSQARLRLAERKLAALAGRVGISKEDVEEAGRRLETFRTQRDRELQSLLESSARRVRERDEALKALEAMRAAGTSAEKSPERDRALLLAEARVRAADVGIQSLGSRSGS